MISNKIFTLLLLTLVLSSYSKKENLRINKTEHVYVRSPRAYEFYSILHDQFELPNVWDYQDWGDFKSAGLTLGNVVPEITEKKSKLKLPQFGIALEANQSLDQGIPFLDSSNIIHGQIIFKVRSIHDTHQKLLDLDFKRNLISDRLEIKEDRFPVRMIFED